MSSPEKQASQEQGGGKEAKKIEARYLRGMETLTAILSKNSAGTDPRNILNRKKKLPNNAVGNLVDELCKEDEEKLALEIKQELSDILKKNVEFNKFVAQAQKEMQEKILNKKKEFANALDAVLNKIDNVGKTREDYLKTLNGSFTLESGTGTEVDKDEEEEDDNKDKDQE